MTEGLMTPAQVADWLAVPESRLGQWRKDGRGPAFVKVGKAVRYRIEDLEQFVEQQVRRPSRRTSEGSLRVVR